MGIKKQLLKSKPICKVTFEITKDLVKNASSVSVLGSFNQWSPQMHPMKKLKDGTFKLTIDLEANTNHQFRYLIDESIWLTDMEADDFVPSGFGDDLNSLIIAR